MVSNGSGVEPHPQGAGGCDPSNAGVSLKKAQLAPSQFFDPQSSSEQSSSEPAPGTDELVPPTPRRCPHMRRHRQSVKTTRLIAQPSRSPVTSIVTGGVP